MQFYIAIGLIAALAVAFTLLVIVPKFGAVTAVDSEIAAAKTELQTAEALLARRQSVKAQAMANDAALMQMANQVPDSPQLPAVIIEIQDVANASGVELLTVSAGEISSPPAAADGSVPQYHMLNISVTSEGQWSEMIDFSRRLHRLKRGTRLTDLAFTYTPETEERDAFINSSATIQVYVMAAASTAAPDGQ
jgi:Tfp pilus assembly protein PilO